LPRRERKAGTLPLDPGLEASKQGVWGLRPQWGPGAKPLAFLRPVIRLLVVDDSALMRRLFGTLFKAQGDFEIAFARDGIEALAQLASFKPHVITLDVQMPRMDGVACLDRIMLEHPCPVVMVSSLTTQGAETTLDALKLGAVDFVAKPGGALSLQMAAFAPMLVEKVRAAAGARIRPTQRLAERVRLRAHRPVPPHRHQAPPAMTRSVTPRTVRAAAAARPGKLPDRAGDKIVLVGTSTGGPPALDALLAPLPADFPWPILVAQHMPAGFTGPLARRLDRLCALTVTEVLGPMPLAPGHVYIGHGEADIVLVRPDDRAASGTALVNSAPPLPEHRWHPSVDRLVGSALEHFAASRLVGVLMTGMGNDGAAAMARLRAQGGRTIAESEETAVVWGMPGELVRAGGAEAVARVETIAALLQDWAA
jgi:two-component system chemotaxis response regulator CheB